MLSYTIILEDSDFYYCIDNQYHIYKKICKYNPYLLRYPSYNTKYNTLFLFNKLIDKDKFLTYYKLFN